MNHLTKAECATISIMATALAVCIVSHNILKISQTSAIVNANHTQIYEKYRINNIAPATQSLIFFIFLSS